jgi:hypothetical protein
VVWSVGQRAGRIALPRSISSAALLMAIAGERWTGRFAFGDRLDKRARWLILAGSCSPPGAAARPGCRTPTRKLVERHGGAVGLHH